jgi:HSP20 family protein
MFSLTPWRGSKQVDHFRNEIDRLFDRFFDWRPTLFGSEEREWVPSMDISETSEEVIVKAEVPGMDAKDIQVSISNNILTIQGEKKHEKEEKEENVHRVERSYGSFYRSIQLPAEVDSEKADATYKKGILKLKLPKTKQASVKKIAIKAA